MSNPLVNLLLVGAIVCAGCSVRAPTDSPTDPASDADAPRDLQQEILESSPEPLAVPPVDAEVGDQVTGSFAEKPESATEAEEEGDPLNHPCRSEDLDEKEDMIEGTSRRLHQTLCSTSLWVDGLFGDRRNIAAARGAHGRVETTAAYSEFYGEKFRTRLHVRVDLPNLEDRLSVFLGRDDEDEFVRDRGEGFGIRSQFPNIADQDEWLAGLGYSLPENERFSSDFRVGVRNLRMPRAFVQSRIRYNAYSDKRNLVHLRLSPFWNTRDRFGITPGVDISRVLSQTRLLRFSNVGTISQESVGFDWRSALILYQSLREKRGVALETFVTGGTELEVSIFEFGSRAIYRQPLSRERLWLEVITGYTWPKEFRTQTRDGSYQVSLALELPFGETANAPPPESEASKAEALDQEAEAFDGEDDAVEQEEQETPDTDS